MATEPKKKMSAEEPASAQLDLFAESSTRRPPTEDQDHDLKFECSEVDGTLRSICLRFKSNDEIPREDLLKCRSRINAYISHIYHERDEYCRNLELKKGSYVSSFSILPAKSPKDHLKRANISIDGRAKDWEKVNSDLKLAFYKTASDTIKGVFLKPRKRTARKYAG